MPHNTSPVPPAGLYALASNDPSGELFDRSSISDDDLAQIGRLMDAMGQLRLVERDLVAASKKYMKLGETDMRALQFVIAQTNQGIHVSPSALASHLNITTASTTKLLDRLEHGGHIHRHPNPHDRRGLTVTVTESTRAAATTSVGRFQVARIPPVLALSAEEREVVIRFLTSTASSLRSAVDGVDAPARDSSAHDA